MYLRFNYVSQATANSLISTFTNLSNIPGIDSILGQIGDIYAYDHDISYYPSLLQGLTRYSPGSGAYGLKSDLLADGYSFDPQYVPTGGQDNILYVNPTTGILGLSAYSYNGQRLSEPAERVLFHELVHSIITNASGTKNTWAMSGYATAHNGSSSAYTFNQSEEIAVYAENSIYSVLASNAQLANGTGYRLGHIQYDSSLSLSGVNPGVGMFSGHAPSISPGSSSVEFTYIDLNSPFAVSRTYYHPGQDIGGYDYTHYTLDSFVSIQDGIHIASSAAPVLTQVATPVLSDVLAVSSSKANISVALGIMTKVEALFPSSYNHSYDRLFGISSSRHIDGYDNRYIDITGPLGAGTYITAPVIAIDASTSVSSIIIGASGFVAADAIENGHAITHEGHDAIHSSDHLTGSPSSDILIAGDGQGTDPNFLEGMGGDDVLIGGRYADQISGGGGRDIYISSPGNDQIVGDLDDVAYYANSTASIRYSNFNVFKTNCVDVVDGVGYIIGTAQSDEFYGDNGITFYGNGGNDLFISGGGNVFIGLSSSPNVSGTVNFSASGGVTITSNAYISTDPSTYQSGHASDGTIWRGIANIQGSPGEDAIYAGNMYSIHGLGGNDTIHGTASGGVFGDDGDDAIILLNQLGSGILDGGSGHDTLDLSQLVVASGGYLVSVDLQNMMASQSQPSGSTLQEQVRNFEDYNFGAVRMQMLGALAGSELRTGDGVSTLLGRAGHNTLVATEVSTSSPTGMNSHPEWTTLQGGSQSDDIIAWRAATINGMGGDDSIHGSDFIDVIRGGQGGDMIWGNGGNDVFQPDYFDANDVIDGGPDIDTFASAISMTEYCFSLGNDGELIIQKYSNSTPSVGLMHFYNVERASFVEGYYGHSEFKMDDATSILIDDADHFMTGQQMLTAIQSLPVARGMIDEGNDWKADMPYADTIQLPEGWTQDAPYTDMTPYTDMMATSEMQSYHQHHADLLFL